MTDGQVLMLMFAMTALAIILGLLIRTSRKSHALSAATAAMTASRQRTESYPKPTAAEAAAHRAATCPMPPRFAEGGPLHKRSTPPDRGLNKQVRPISETFSVDDCMRAEAQRRVKQGTFDKWNGPDPQQIALDDWGVPPFVIEHFPVALVKGQRLVLDGRFVIEVDATHLCHSRENLMNYIRSFPHTPTPRVEPFVPIEPRRPTPLPYDIEGHIDILLHKMRKAKTEEEIRGAARSALRYAKERA